MNIELKYNINIVIIYYEFETLTLGTSWINSKIY